MKRTTEGVLRGELLSAKKELEVAIAKRDLRAERAAKATGELEAAKGDVVVAIETRNRARNALEAFLGRKLDDEELVAGGFRNADLPADPPAETEP